MALPKLEAIAKGVQKVTTNKQPQSTRSCGYQDPKDSSAWPKMTKALVISHVSMYIALCARSTVFLFVLFKV